MLWQLLRFIFINPPLEDGNPEVMKYPLTGAAIYILLIDLVYVVFVFKIGPKLMKNRPAFNCRYIMMIYNVLQIIVNAYLFVSSIGFLKIHTYIGCIEKLPHDHPKRELEIWLVYVYYMNKFMDYADTVFFVLRKSYRQVTFLHVYHHILMTSAPYLHIRTYGYGGHIVGVGFLNCFVHIVMYTYYLLSAMRPDLKQNTWWKKYITQLQILQFSLILAHQLWPLIINVECRFSEIWLIASCTQAVIMLLLFWNFYKRTYLSGKRYNIKNEKLKVQ